MYDKKTNGVQIRKEHVHVDEVGRPADKSVLHAFSDAQLVFA